MVPVATRGYLRGMESRAQLRAELVDAITNVRRRIEGAQIFVGIGRGQMTRDLRLGKLRHTLAGLEEALANLEADNAKGS
jgi:hypothetical protein